MSGPHKGIIDEQRNKIKPNLNMKPAIGMNPGNLASRYYKHFVRGGNSNEWDGHGMAWEEKGEDDG